ncbi:hypothetical protein MUO14_09520 [Halobacillus shinanisalinarum]|uniref:Uncharacterized protein n=1 Tax=Halobacillus shinanisalinarum TaxID=2932258 RepID=A0ABY4H4J4_9BACI|nr:hypothetical protein [Halobacillus shinanisalinarum]UOQ95136.1 hypothetical protein MUO14_09520 [Halobacillus shinanisalinarum]
MSVVALEDGLWAALAFTTKTFNQELIDSMLGFVSGVMIVASFWSLPSPALDMEEGKGLLDKGDYF